MNGTDNNDGADNTTANDTTTPAGFGGVTGTTPAPADNNGTTPAENAENAENAGGTATPAPAGGENGTGTPEPSPAPAVDYPGLPEGVKEGSLEGDFISKFQGIAKTAGVSADVYKSLLDGVMEFNGDLEKSMEDQRLAQSTEQVKVLKQTYGGKFGAVMEQANNALRSLSAEFNFDADVFLTPELRNNPEVIKLFSGLSEKFREAGFASASAPMANALSEATAIMTDPAHKDYAIYNDPSHPRWKEVSERVTRYLAGGI